MLRIAHRGASGNYPENTIKAFEEALKLEVDMIELDCHICKSGEVIVIHDDNLNRLTGVDSCIDKLSLEEVKSLKIFENHQIPTLTEVLNFVDKRCILFIEIKKDNMALAVYKLVKSYIDDKGYNYDNIILGSFIYEELMILRKLDKNLQIAYITVEAPILTNKIIEEIAPNYINPNFKHITKEFLENIHIHNIKSLAWTVNKTKDIEKLRAMSIDGIMSDFPKKIIK